MKTPKKILPLLICTRNGQASTETFMSLNYVAHRLGRTIYLFIGTAPHLISARNYVLESIFELIGKEEEQEKEKEKEKEREGGMDWNGRGFMVDADVILKPNEHDVSKLVDAVLKSDSEGWSFSVPYPINTGIDLSESSVLMEQSVFRLADGVLKPARIGETIPDYEKIDASGLGFYYGYLPPRYTFHYDESGEDINFFMENRDKIDLRVLNLKEIYHSKQLLD